MTPLGELDLRGMRVLDGALATELERRGSDILGPLWSAAVLDDAPERIEAVHASYLDAGADCILTASYQISAQGYREVGRSSEQAAAALRRSVSLAATAREAYRKRTQVPEQISEGVSTLAPTPVRSAQFRARDIWIAASLGAYGATLHNGAEYHGNYDCTFDDLVEFHAARLEVLQSTEADYIAFETLPSHEEARAIVAALDRYPTMGAWLSFTCADGEHVAHGERIADCARLLDGEDQVVAIGINCTAPRWVENLIGETRGATSKPVVAYPNSGETWDAQGRRWLGHSDTATFSARAMEWFKAGAQAVGGCCRTGPEHIQAIRAALDSQRLRFVDP